MDSNPNWSPPIRIDSGEQISVTIGRNVESTPMSPDDWAEFTNQVNTLIRSLTSPTLSFTYDGTGEWEGVSEEARHFVFVTSRPTTRQVLRAGLADLAGLYGQDAIAFSHGANCLARASVRGIEVPA